MDSRDSRGFEPDPFASHRHESARNPKQHRSPSARAGSPQSLQSAQYRSTQVAQSASAQPVYRQPQAPQMRQQHPSRVNPHAPQSQYRAASTYQSHTAGRTQGTGQAGSHPATRPQGQPMRPKNPSDTHPQTRNSQPQTRPAFSKGRGTQPQVRGAYAQNRAQDLQTRAGRPQGFGASQARPTHPLSSRPPQARPTYPQNPRPPQARPARAQNSGAPRPQGRNALSTGRSYAHAGYSSNRAYSNRKAPHGYVAPYGSRRSIFSGSSRYYSCRRGGTSLSPRLVLALAAVLLIGFGVFTAYSAMQRNAAEIAAREEAAAQKEALKKQTVKPSKLGQTALPASTPKNQWKQGTMPHLYQTDPAWAEKPYARDTVRISGCGPTTLAMVYVYLTGKTDYDPASMAAFADANNFAPTGATEWSFMSSGANMLGLYSQTLPVARGEITRALNAGKPLIVSVSPGDFTLVGHFMVLKSIDECGMVEVFDPNSPLRSSMRWPIMRMLPQINNVWAFSA